MLLLMPPTYVPLMVAAGNLLGDIPVYLTRRRHPARAVFALSEAWYAVAPAMTIAALAGGSPNLSDWPVYLLALAGAIALDCLVTTVREWYELGVTPRRQLEGYAWIAAVDALLAPIGLLAALAAYDDPETVVLLIPLLGLLLLFARERQSRIDSSIKLRNAYLGTSVMLADMLEEDDHYTGHHSRSVVSLSTRVADVLGLDRSRRRLVEFSALLHDIGKIAISKEIINKPGPLDEDEWRLMKTHTIEGQRMLEPVGGVLAEVGRIVRASHEHWDGRGYPDGLRGDEIPLEARIVSACDAFNAMTTDRSYRSALQTRDAIDQLSLYAGSQFDPVVAVALVGVIRRAANGTDPMDAAVPVPDLFGAAAAHANSA
jgi:HD-GYP domain-containing protein (c-di-GMP phosphodiesterase class II)